MRTTTSQYAKALMEISLGTSASDQRKIAKDFFDFLRRKGESKKVLRIVKKMESLQDERSGIRKISVTTAFPMDASVAKEMEDFAKKVFGSESVSLDARTDGRIIGGAILKTETDMVDMSVVGTMKHLRRVLRK